MQKYLLLPDTDKPATTTTKLEKDWFASCVLVPKLYQLHHLDWLTIADQNLSSEHFFHSSI